MGKINQARMNYRRARKPKTMKMQKTAAYPFGYFQGSQKKANKFRGGAGMKKELKTLKCKGYFKRSRAPRHARSS